MSEKKKPPRPSPSGTARQTSQRGGFAVGLIVGLLIGLALALGVALYVTKMPAPFMNKVPQRSPSQDAAEAEKNRNWDPNSPLYGKNPARPNAVASDAAAAPPPMALPPGALPAPAVTGNAGVVPAPRASAPQSSRDPAAILADKAALPKIVTTSPGAAADG
ncbi:MAG: hypothetical protein M3O01_03720, partial [Pseudomonadota bacterium]|nr:hypothetical protein [Pseudomonadota bacterium]